MRGWRESLFVRSGCQHMRCKSFGWNALAVLPQHSTHCDVCTGLLLYSLSEDTLDVHTLHPANKLTVLNKSRSTYAACEIQVTTLSSLPDTYFEACMPCIYTCIYRICTYLSAATKERQRGESPLHPVLTTLMMFRTAEDDVWLSARPWLHVCLFWGGWSGVVVFGRRIVQPGFWGCRLW